MDAKDKIKKQLLALGMSQSKLAELSGISFATINRILNGKQNITEAVLAKIANALNLSVEQLEQDDTKEVFDSDVQGYIEYDGEIRKVKSFASLQKLVSQIEYETKVLPKEAKDIIAINKNNKAAVIKAKRNDNFQFNTD